MEKERKEELTALKAIAADENNFDTILTMLGTGKWNWVYYIMLSYWYACICYHTLGGAFLAPKVDFTCHAPEFALDPQTAVEFEHATQNLTSHVPENETRSNEKYTCAYLVRDNDTNKILKEKCTEWDFNNSTFTSTFTSEFGLVCQKEYLRVTFQSAYMFGILGGSVISGYLSDKFGRRTTLMSGSIIYTFIAIGSAWLPSVTTVLTARFLLGLLHPASLQIAFILGMEITEPKYRTTVGIAQFFSWGVATMCWGGLAYLIRDWRYLQLTISLHCLLFLPSLWIMDESPRWLIVSGRHKDALKVLKRAKRWNKSDLPSDEKLLILMQDIHKRGKFNEERTTNSVQTQIVNGLNGVLILFRTPRLRMITISMMVNFFVVSLVFFGLNLSGGSFNVDPYVYMVIAGVVEIPANTVLIPFVAKFGRKMPTILFYIITAASMLIQPFLSADYNWLAITSAMIGKMCISASFQILFLYITELFPTEVRTRGMGAAIMVSRGGAILAPYIVGMIGATYTWIAPVVFGLSSFIACLITLPLRETSNIVLPDTIAELEGHEPDNERKENEYL